MPPVPLKNKDDEHNFKIDDKTWIYLYIFCAWTLTFCIYRDFCCCCIADAAAATYAATTAEAALQGVGIDITVAQTN